MRNMAKISTYTIFSQYCTGSQTNGTKRNKKCPCLEGRWKVAFIHRQLNYLQRIPKRNLRNPHLGTEYNEFNKMQ
jgi:hypothetical protein